MVNQKAILDAAKQGAQTLGKAVSPIATQNVKLLFGVSKELDRLSSTVATIEAVLKDAQRNPPRSFQDGLWVDNLARLRDDAVDLLNSYSARRRLHDGILDRRFDCVSLANYAVSLPGYWISNYKTAVQVGEIRERLDAACQERKTVRF